MEKTKMIWCRFQASGRNRTARPKARRAASNSRRKLYATAGSSSYGIVEGDNAVPVEGTPFGEYRRSAEKLPLAAVKLLVPVTPGTFYCAGVNYADHVTKMAKKRGEEPKLPTRAEIGYRSNNALLEHEGNMIFDAATFISETSRYCTIQAGDVMWLGTDGAPQNMKPGDTIEIEITGIGTLRNYVVAEA
jgi:2-keto-4-pentenoate hydratase/2-oxohepta-3-ene-1,7-dioic acid hydratase in catechol pathway